MFTKILIANRGEIAVRIIRTCRQMGIETVALYTPSDKGSLHVRLADECVALESPADFTDAQKLIQMAQQMRADAIHPGYGFLAEKADFIRACQEAGLEFIGPPVEVVARMSCKQTNLQAAQEAGFPTVEFSHRNFAPGEEIAMELEAERMGYPLVVKSCNGGRGLGARWARNPAGLGEAVRHAQTEARRVYGDEHIYLEKAIPNAHQIGVQILADQWGQVVQLGDHEGSLQIGNRKIIEETPAPCLTADQRTTICQTALELARFFKYQNVGTVEFLVDENGQFYFTEIKARLRVEHPLTEMVTGLDLVREQIRLAAGEAIPFEQGERTPRGWAMLARVRAVDPSRDFLPSPGVLQDVRWPDGLGVRVDSYVYPGCFVPGEFDPVIAKLMVWGEDRAACLRRFKLAIEELRLTGIPTNVPLIQKIVQDARFQAGQYSTEFLTKPLSQPMDAQVLRDMAAIAAVLFVRRRQTFNPSVPDRVWNGWHRESRRLPDR